MQLVKMLKYQKSELLYLSVHNVIIYRLSCVTGLMCICLFIYICIYYMFIQSIVSEQRRTVYWEKWRTYWASSVNESFCFAFYLFSLLHNVYNVLNHESIVCFVYMIFLDIPLAFFFLQSCCTCRHLAETSIAAVCVSASVTGKPGRVPKWAGDV